LYDFVRFFIRGIGGNVRFAKKPNFGAASLVMLGILLSRIAGLVRERVFAHYFGGISVAAGAFRSGLRIPNFLQNLFGEGVLSASFIPVYSKLLSAGDEELAGRVAGAVATILALFVSLAAALGMLLTPWIVDLIVPGFSGEARQLTVQIVRILFPAIAILVLSSWCLGILNSHRKFFLSYVAPVLWNAAMIATMVALGRRWNQESLAVALAWGTVAGSLLQIGVQLPFVFRYARKIRFAFAVSLPPVKKILRTAGPTILGRGVVQISAYVDQFIASFLNNGAGAVSVLGYAQTIYLLPISLFGMSVAASELPEMSSILGDRNEIAAQLRARLEAAVRQVTFFIIPTVVGFLAIGRILVSALYETGHFGRSDSTYVWYVLMGSTIGLLAATRGRVYNSAFYALHDTVTPLRFAVIRVILTGALGYVFAFPLQGAIAGVFTGLLHLPAPRPEDAGLVFGSVGLTASAGIAGWVEYLLLRSALHRRIGPVPIRPGYYIQLVAASIPAAVCALGAAIGVSPWLRGLPFLRPSWQPVADGLLALAAFATVYLSAALWLRVPEAKRLFRG
jgi:putative peptidoglycan lipid II flippase